MGPVRRRAAWIAGVLALLATAPPSGGCQRDRGAPAGDPVVTGASGRPDGGPGAADGGFPVVVRDHLGHDVAIAAEPRRIVTLIPSHTEMLVALGLGDRIVGVDDFSDPPAGAAQVPRVGGLYDAHIEQIVALAPDLVLASQWGNAAERLSALGLHVWAGSASKFDDVYRVLESVGQLTGRGGAATTMVARIHAEVEAVEAPLRALPRVRVYYEIDATPYTAGPGSFIGVMLAKAGGEDIIPEGLGDYPRISPELVISRDPEVILGVTPEDAARRPGWSAITAVRRGRVGVLPQAERDVVVRAGPRLAEGLRLLVRRLHPEVAP